MITRGAGGTLAGRSTDPCPDPLTPQVGLLPPKPLAATLPQELAKARRREWDTTIFVCGFVLRTQTA